MIVSTPVLGLVADRSGRHLAVMLSAAVSGACAIAAVVFLGEVAPSLVVAALFVCIGTCLGASVLVFTLVKLWNPQSISGVAGGFVNTVTVSCGSLASPVAGAFIDMGWEGTMG